MRIENPFNTEITNNFNIDEFHSNDKELSEIIEYTKKTHNEDLLNLCEKMFYSMQNGISIEQYLFTAKELYKKIKYENLIKQYQERIASIKELEIKLKEEISRQDSLLKTLNKLKESHLKDQEELDKMEKYLKAKELFLEPTKDDKEETSIDDFLDDDVTDYSYTADNQEEDKKDDITLLLLADNLTLNFDSFEEKKLDNNMIYLNYKLKDNTSYNSIVDTDLNLMVTDINKIIADDKKLQSTKYKRETINLIGDVLNDIKGYYKYKEYVRYYYNSFKNNLNEALDYEKHKKLLFKLTKHITSILENISYYLSIDNINFKELDECYHFSNNDSIIISKLLDSSKDSVPISTKDVLYSIYDKELLDTMDTKTLK